MDNILRRLFIPFIFLFVIIEATDSDYNETSPIESRQTRSSPRIVKLYSGTKPEPIICAGEGFQKDPYNCAVFYRCVKSSNGKYTVFRFQCGPGTVYDPETEVCNHPGSTKRSECGGLVQTIADTNHVNEIESMNHEIPSPIIMNQPIYIASTSTIKTTTSKSTTKPSLSTDHSTTKREVTTTSKSPYPWGSTIHQIYVENSATSYPLTPTTITTRPFTTSSYGTYTTTSTSQILQANSQDNICTSDGFMGDSVNCRKFYRCVANQRGGFTRYEFSCTEGTIWDDDSQICNHLWAVKRSRCMPRSDKNISSNSLVSNEKVHSQDRDSNKNISKEDKPNTNMQQQLQISYGSKVTQTQTQISNGSVVQNQTQIHYGDRINPDKNKNGHQNQTQVSHGSAISQTQTQIEHGSQGVQTQVQINHSEKASQSQIQINHSSTKATSTTTEQNIKVTNTLKSNECTELGYAGDAHDCQKFYRCVENGHGGYAKYEFSCSEGTVWDQNIQACNHAWAVKECGSSTSTEASTHTVTKTTDGTTQSYHTTTSTAKYQENLDTEDLDSDADTGYQKPENKPTSSPSTTTTSIPLNSSKAVCTSSGFIGDDNDCKIFYRCVENANGGYVKHEFKCGEGTVWDPEIEACNHAWAVEKCGGNASPDINKTETTTIKLSTSSSIPLLSTSTIHPTTSEEIFPSLSEPINTADNEESGYQKPEQVSTISFISTTTMPTSTDGSKSRKCTSSGFMGDENDCRIFYRCVENGSGGYIRYEFKCGEGTVWDAEIEACNHAWAVKKCGGNASPDITQIETTTKKVSSSSFIPPTSIHSTTSTENYQTINESVDTADNEDSGYQVPDQIPTISSSISSTTIPTTVNGLKSGECTSSGFMGDDINCKIFYRCVDDGNGGYVKHEFKCGEGTVWDAEIGACNHAWAVKKCGGSLSSGNNTDIETTTIKLSMSSSTSMSSTTTIQMADNNDYDAGYESSNSHIPTTISPPKQPQTLNRPSIVCNSSGYIGDKNNCKKFYRCVDNGEGGFISYEFTCSEGTVWDSKIDACNHDWAVDNKCGESTVAPNVHETDGTTELIQNISTSMPTTLKTTTIIGSLSASTGKCTQSGYMGDSKNCKKFYRCVDNGDGTFIKYEYSCGEGTLWDQEIETCNHAWAVTSCGSNVASPGEQLPTTTEYHPGINDEIDNSYPSNDNTDSDNNIENVIPHSTTEASKESSQSNFCINSGFIADKNNCKKFYRCVDDGNGGFIRYEFDCGEGTVWDQSIEACNHAWAVKECGSNNTVQIPNEQGTPSTVVTTMTSLGEDKPHVTESALNTEKETTAGCSDEGFIGDLNNCKIFYRCVNNGKGDFTKYEFSCGEGTYWNQEILSCDHVTSDKECRPNYSSTSKVPQHEHDEDFIETSPLPSEDKDVTPKPPTSSGLCTSEGFYGNQNDCKKFYRCVDNGEGGYTKYDFSCGDGTVWDQDLQTCNHETDKCVSPSPGSPQTTEGHSQHEGDTNLQTTTEKKDILTSTSSPTTSTVNCDSEGFFANPNDCRMFIRCVKDDKDGFTKYHFTCAEGTIWVQEMLTCDHDTDGTKCSNQTVTKPVNSEDHQQTVKYEPSTTEYVLADAQNDKFNNSNSKPSPGSDLCSSDGYYGNKKDCRKFYRCVDNGMGGYTKYDYTCSEGTAWDSTIEACNHIDQVLSCKESVLHDENNTPTTENPATSSQGSTTTTSTTQKNTAASQPESESNIQNSQSSDTCDSEGYFGNTQDCKKFYRCVDNGNGGYTKYDFTCAEGTIWDQDLTTCNHPGDVEKPTCNHDNNMTEGSSSGSSSSGSSSSGSSSSDSSSTSTTESSMGGQEDTSKNPENNDISCTKAGFYPNPNDCKKFYRCVDWDGDGSRFSVYHFDCGEGTIWDPAVETCNHEESVYPPRNCGQSLSENSPSTTESTTTTIQEQTTSESTTTKITELSPSTTESTTSTTTEQSVEGTTQTPEQSTTENPEEGTTEKPGESTTKAPEESSTEQSGEGTTGKPSQTTTEQSGEGTTENQSETTTAQSTEGTTEKAAESTTEISGESTTEQSSIGTSEKPIESTTEASGDSTTEQSVEGTSEKPIASTTEQSGESTTEQPGESTTEQPGESTTEQPSESITKQPGVSTTEEPGESTTEQSTEGTTEKLAESTTEQTGESTTEQTGTTQEGSNTEGSTSEQPTTTTTEQTATNESSTTESETETTTDESSVNKECPETEDDQYLFVCPSSFRRHPKYCNLFYQCDVNEETHEIKTAVFTCPNGTIYDESQIKCVEESKADKQCDGAIAQNRRVKRRDRIDEHEPIVVSKDSYACPAAGYYAFEKDGDCSPGFLKCKRNKANKLRGFVYQCPEGYIFWSVSRRCERMGRVRDCKRSVLNSWSRRWEIPLESKNVAWK